MKWKTIISFCLMMLAAVGCMKEDAAYEDGGYSVITGQITDTEGMPVEHIRVTLSIEGAESEVVYSSSEGIYMAMFKPIWDKTGTMKLDLTIEDIDSEANRDSFAALSDIIIIYKENMKDGIIEITKDYRLSPATL